MEKNYFKECKKLINSENGANNIFDGEKFAVDQLIIATSFSMKKVLMEKHEGWWKQEKYPLEYLYEMREKAINEKNHIEVMNYTAMIAMMETEI